MRSAKQSQFGSSQERKARAPLAFRFSKEQPKKSTKASPFTEMPEELKHNHFTLGGLLRTVFNTLLLVVLVAALLALVAAFAYQMIYNPEALAEASYRFISTVQQFLQSVTGAE